MPYFFHFLPCDSGPKFSMNLKSSTTISLLHRPRLLKKPEKYPTSIFPAYLPTSIKRTQLTGENRTISKWKINVHIFMLPIRDKERKKLSNFLLCGNFRF